MAMTTYQEKKLQVQEQGERKYKCRICKKGFNRRRALYAHMRSHEINDELILNPDEGPSTARGEWGSADGKRAYNVCISPNRHRILRICKTCGKEFHSWELMLEHSCCSSVVATAGLYNDDPGLSPSSSSRSSYKGKRTRRGGKPSSSSPPPHLFSDEVELANCLVMLSASRAKPSHIADVVEHSSTASKEVADMAEPSSSASKVVEEDILPPLLPHLKPSVSTQNPPNPGGMFECKACKKVFPSHQALGGHRASHKKVKGCFAARLEIESPDAKNVPIEHNNNNNNINHQNNQIGSSSEDMHLAIVPLAEHSPLPLPKTKSKLHVCSICKRQFPTGQALGGHKRCHWITSKTGKSDVAAIKPMIVTPTMLEVGSSSSIALRQMFNCSDQTLDLNKPAPMDDLAGIPLRLDMPTVIHLQPEWNIENMRKEGKGSTARDNDNAKGKALNESLDDEADSREVKRVKLSDLMDMNDAEESSTWLQIGIGSTPNLENSADRATGPNI